MAQSLGDQVPAGPRPALDPTPWRGPLRAGRWVSDRKQPGVKKHDSYRSVETSVQPRRWLRPCSLGLAL